MKSTHKTGSELILNEERLFGAMPTSDAAFIVSLRNRLHSRDRNIWIGASQAILALSGASLLVFLIAMSVPTADVNVQLVDISAPIEESVNELVVFEADPAELAEYLGIPEVSDTSSVDSDINTGTASEQSVEPVFDVSSDELLKLDDSELELVLSELDETVFF